MSSTLDRGSLWTRMQFLLKSLGTRLDGTTFIEDLLDLLVGFLKADRGVIFARNEAGTWVPIATRQKRLNVATLEIDDTRIKLIDDTLRAGRPTITELDEESGRTMAVTVPLRRGAWRDVYRGSRSLGVLYLEKKHGQSLEVTSVHSEFLESAAILASITLDHRAKLEEVQEDLRVARVHDSIEDGPSLDQILESESLSDLRSDIEACVVGNSSVMILGESGTGKTRLATAVAKASGRMPIVRATLGASDDLNTITSELFGHERGAYSGAVTARKGLVEYADGGTLVLDEILNLPPHAQQLLLDFTQFGTYRPLGFQGKEPKRANLRIISVTNGNIRQAIADTRFRQDLYFRLAGVTITLPPLRERRHEVPKLAQQYLRQLDHAGAWQLSAGSRRLLLSDIWDWEGNIRQLQAVMRRARDRALVEKVSNGLIEAHHIGRPARSEVATHSAKPTPTKPPTESISPTALSESSPIEDRWAELQTQRSSLESIERDIIDRAMSENRGVVAHAAKQLQLSRTSLLSRMSTLHIDKDKYRR